MEQPMPRYFKVPLKNEDERYATGRGRKRMADSESVQNSKKPKVEWETFTPAIPAQIPFLEVHPAAEESPSPARSIRRYFDFLIKYGDVLNPTARKIKAEINSVLLVKSKKTKVEERFQEATRRTISLPAATEEAQISGNCKNNDKDEDVLLPDYSDEETPAIAAEIPFLEVHPAAEESPSPPRSILRYFDYLIKDGDVLNPTASKIKAEINSVLLVKSKKTKVEEGFQEPTRRTISLPAATEEARISGNCKNNDKDEDVLLPDYSDEETPAIAAEIPSPSRDSSSLDETEEYWNQKQENFEHFYKEEQWLGRGGFGDVYAGISMYDNSPVAIKHIPKHKVKYCEGDVELMITAAGNNGRCCKYNPGVIKLMDVVELKNEEVIVTEHLDNAMDLHSYIKQNHKMQEQEVKVIIHQVLNAAAIMHKNGVFHRDIKAKNIVISNTDGTPTVKIIDFGCGDWVKDEPYDQFAGTRQYAPPEYFFEKQSDAEPTTVWQIGLLLYNMCTRNRGNTYKYIKSKRRTINGLSQMGNKFLKQCLTINPDLRPGFENLLDHPWLKD